MPVTGSARYAPGQPSAPTSVTPGSSPLLVLLILQPALAGGSSPPELLSGFPAATHAYPPMAYLADAFRSPLLSGCAPTGRR